MVKLCCQGLHSKLYKMPRWSYSNTFILSAGSIALVAWSILSIVDPEHNINLKMYTTELPREVEWMPPERHSKPNFRDFGKDRIHEYLYACASNFSVPEVVWSFWFSDEPMSENRRRAAETMERALEVPVILVTEDNLNSFTKWPVNPNVRFLSGNHQSDYFRIYFLLHYGGYVQREY